MKKLLLLALALSATCGFAQNSTPEIAILSTEVDEAMQQVTLNFQLEDANNDLCDVWLKYAIDGGTYFEEVDELATSGDIGEGITPDDQLSMVWDYSDFSGSLADVRLQVVASDNAEVSIADMVAQVDESELLSSLEAIEGERHYIAEPGHLADVRTLIEDAFSAAALQTEGHNFVYDDTDMQNIIGRKPGLRDEAITYIIDGHFDGVPGSPGADDNGSAVAGVLEALRILSQYSFEHSIRFIGFDAEELGLIGSLRYVQNGIKPFEDIQGVLNFEMIGYYSDEPNSQTLPAGFNLLFPDVAQAISDDENRGNFLTVIGNVASNPLIAAYMEASETYVPELRVLSAAVPGVGMIAPDLRRSDHSRFWDADYQALMLTDASEFRNFNYHTPNDVIATLDFEFMANVVKATVAAAAELAVPISAASAEVDLSTIVTVEDHAHDYPGKLRIYPNPSNGILSIEISDVAQPFTSRLEVYELSGKVVHKEVLTFTSGTSTTKIDLQRLAAGAYILVMRTGDAFTSESFVLED